MTTSEKLWLGFGTLTALLVLFSANMIVRLQSVAEQVTEQANVTRPLSVATKELEINILDYTLGVHQYINTGDPKTRKTAEKDADDVEQYRAEYERLATTNRQRELATRFTALWREFKALGQVLMDSKKNPVSTRENVAKFNNLRIGLERFLDDEMQADAVEAFNASRDVTLQTVNSSMLFALTLLILSVVLAGITSWAVGRGIVEYQRQLWDSRESLRITLASIGDAVITTDTEGRTTYLNGAAESLTGWRNAEAAGQPLDAVFRIINRHTHQPVENPATRVLREGLICRLANHTVLIAKDGTERPLDETAAPIRDERGRLTGVVLVAHDLTERKRLENQSRQAQRMEAFGQLAGGVAHDFNNLLTVIFGYSDVLTPMLPPDGPTRTLVNSIRQAGERAASLTRQLLAFSRKQALEPKVLDLNEVVKNVEKMLRRLIGADIDLIAVLDPAISPVKVDPGQLEQVLINLAVNARDAMPQGGNLTIESRNAELDEAYCRDHPGSRPGKYVMVSVTDTGYGMTPEVQAHMFEPFFTTKEVGKGTGLGLATVYGIVKQSGGYIALYSEPGQGTSFKVYLPQVQEMPPKEESLPGVRPVPHGNETVLLVEDEDAVRQLAQHILQAYGYSVLVAADGDEAIRLAESHQGPIHGLVSDVVMPHMNGRVVAERIAALKPGIKVMFVSGYTDDAVVRNGIVPADTAFLHKPFSTSQLAQKVRDVLDKRE